MNQPERDKKAYSLAKKYLLDHVEGLTPEILEKYLFPNPKSRPKNIAEIYERILRSSQNANMKKGVIEGAIGEVRKLGIVLFDFQPDAILKKYKSSEPILDDIENKLKPRGKIRRTSRSIWPQFCKTILSGAEFMTQFKSAEDFYDWVDLFYKNPKIRLALPMILQQEIKGFGFALACDFIKGLGFTEFGKPDVQLRDIFTSLKLCDEKASSYELLKVIIRVAGNAQVTPYNADKIFWLIGSGNFYNDKQIGNNGRVSSMKIMFVSKAKPLLL